MKDMTKKEMLLLGKDLKNAKILVLHKHGFTCGEIANIMGISESVVRKLVTSFEDSNK